MVSLTLDYKPTHQQSNCKICEKLIERGQKRVKLDNDNSYQKDIKYYHLNCLLKEFNKFKEFKWEKIIS